jgi:hypothetical protein
MENIKFFLQEKDPRQQENAIMTPLPNDPIQLELYYKTRYNVKSLNQILQYYGIHKSKMVKDEMLQVLVFFETDPANADLVFHRIRLWQNIQELKADSYFSKYIMF